MTKREKIGIIGSGLIGRSWSMIFASTGCYDIHIYDIAPKQVSSGLTDIKCQLDALQANGMLRGSLSPAEQLACIKGTSSLENCVKGCTYIQECAPENLELKKKIFNQLDAIVDPDTILASSTSCIMPSKFTEQLKHRGNCVVVHPVNPPYYVTLVEIVPSPWTCKSVVENTRLMMEAVGQSPVTLSREHPGFALNRIQYAILNESINLVKDGLLSVADVDKVMTEGLAPRYAWMGPLETGHLNAEGMKSYVERYGTTISTVSSTIKFTSGWTVEELQPVIEQLDARFPLDKLQERRYWRDHKLIALAKLKKEVLNKQD